MATTTGPEAGGDAFWREWTPAPPRGTATGWGRTSRSARGNGSPEPDLELFLRGISGALASSTVFAAEDPGSAAFLGDDLLAWLLLALGGALFVGNVLALSRPRTQSPEGELARAPVARTVVMAVVGLVAALWALGTLLLG